MTTVNEDAILTTLRQQGQMTANKLAGQLDIAASTARRNLAKLEKAEVVRRVVIADNPKTYGWAAVEPKPERPEGGGPGNPAADDLDAIVDEVLEPSSEPVDEEIDAMRAILERMTPMDTAARHRVMRWVCDKLNLDVTF